MERLINSGEKLSGDFVLFVLASQEQEPVVLAPSGAAPPEHVFGL